MTPWTRRKFDAAFGMARGPFRRFKTLIVGLFGCLTVFGLGGCAETADAPPAKLLLYCGAGIRPAASEVAATFGQKHRITVECDYAGSEVLLGRIKLSGRGDLYMPGDVHYINQAAEEGLIEKRQQACYFIPVILVAKGNPKKIASLEDLTKPGVRLGLGDSNACAIGRKSTKIFQKNDLPLDAIEENVVFRSLTVNELGNQVKLGMVDAAIVWDAVAAYFAEQAEVVAIPPEKNVISTVVVGMLSSTEHPELAGKFVEFIGSEEARAIFKKHHYAVELPE